MSGLLHAKYITKVINSIWGVSGRVEDDSKVSVKKSSLEVEVPFFQHQGQLRAGERVQELQMRR